MARRVLIGPKGKGHQPQRVPLEFDFVVAERPKYIPGSGPPLAPITIMPPHDIDGFIIAEVELYKELKYVVGYEEYPHLHVAVRPENILKWVSAHALEKWESDEFERKQREREELELPLIEAKEERRRKRLEKRQKLSRGGLQQEATKSRKRKRASVPEKPAKARTLATPVSRRPGPSRRNEPSDEEEAVFTSPKLSQRSRQQRSLSGAGLANRAILDSESEDEDSLATDMAIEFQLKGQTNRLSRSNLQSSPSTSQTPDRLSPDPSTTNQRQRSHNLPRSLLSADRAVAATSSSLEARRMYEEIEGKANKKAPTIADKYSYTKRASQFMPKTASKLQHSTTASSSRTLNVEPEDETDGPEEESEDDVAADEEVYELKAILQDEVRIEDNGNQVRWFLIDWVGDWENTWEPEENIDPNAIAVYKKKGKQKSRFGMDGSRDSVESDYDVLFVSEGKGKGKEVQRGQVIDDGDDDSP